MGKKAEMSSEMVKWGIAIFLLLALVWAFSGPVKELAEDLLDKIRFPTGELPAITYDEERIPVDTELSVYPPDIVVRKQAKGWELIVKVSGKDLTDFLEKNPNAVIGYEYVSGPLGTTKIPSYAENPVLENEELVTVLNSDKLIGGEGYAAIKIVGRTYVHAPNPEDIDPSTPDLMWFIDKKDNKKYDGTDEKVTTKKVAEQILAMLYEEAT